MHNIEYNAYLELIYYCFFSMQSVSINGQVVQVPNMYKMMYQMFDGANKGFMCEHDIFQIMWSINQGKQDAYSTKTESGDGDIPPSGGNYHIGYSSYADTEALSLSVNFKDSFPKIKRSVFIESF